MTDRVFIDTNILVYAKFEDGAGKYKIADKLLRQEIKHSEVYISTQVVNEFYINAIRKGKPKAEVQSIAERFLDKFNIVSISMHTVQGGWRIFNEYRFSYWDCLVVAAALEAQSAVLYTEDLTNGQIIDGSLKVLNPFV